MSNPSTSPFPSPIGGIPLANDLAPSIVFACLYACLMGLAVYRVSRPISRTISLFAALFFVIERTLIWSLRAWESQTPSEDYNRHLLSYWQSSFVTGYIAVVGKLAFLLRVLIVNTTYPPDADAAAAGYIVEIAKTPTPQYEMGHIARREATFDSQKGLEEAVTETVVAVEEDQPYIRARYRRVFNCVMLTPILPLVLTIAMTNQYPDVDRGTNVKKSKVVEVLRYFTAVIILGMILAVQIIACYAMVKARRLRRDAVFLVLCLSGIIMIIPIYQLAILRSTTIALTSTAPGSQNTPTEKALFYVLQAVPEITCVGTLLSINMRSVFGTGMWGDHLKGQRDRKT